MAGAVVFIACAPPPDPEPELQCSETKACEGGLVCVENACVPCRLDRECGRTELCHPIDRLCVMRPCFGDACVVHDDCDLGEFCVQGLCLSASEPHPDGCGVVSCADGEACNEGQRCDRTNFVCEEDLGCEADDDCSPDERCHVDSGRCEAACTPETAEEKCGLLRVCHDGACVDCTEDAHCGPGLACDAVAKQCRSLFSCASNRDCELPQVCNRRTGQCTSDPGPCRSNDDCAADELCSPTSGACRPAVCPEDRYSPNQTLAQAAIVPAGLIPSLMACNAEPDFFRLPLAAGDRFAVSVDADPLLPVDLALLDTNGRELNRSTERYAEASALLGGDHYIRISSPDHTVAYGLRVFVTHGTPCVSDSDEPNDDFVSATRIVAGDRDGRTICPGDRDWYTLDVPLGATLDVELLSTPGENPLEIHLYDSNGTSLLVSGDGGSAVEVVRWTGFSGSRAYVLVRGANGGVQNGYDLRVRFQ